MHLIPNSKIMLFNSYHQNRTQILYEKSSNPPALYLVHTYFLTLTQESVP